MGALEEVNLMGSHLQHPEHITVIPSAKSEMNGWIAATSYKPLEMLATKDAIFVMLFSRRRETAHSQVALAENVTILWDM